MKRGNRPFQPGYSYAVIDPAACAGVDECSRRCPERCYFGAIETRDGKAVSDPYLCHGCGQCFTYCPSGAAKAVRKEGYELTFCAERPPVPDP